MGEENSDGYLTILIFPGGVTQFTIHHPDHRGSTGIEVIEKEKTIAIKLEGIQKAHILRIHCHAAPQKVVLDGVSLSDSVDYHFDNEDRKLVIKTGHYADGEYMIFK